MMDNSAQTETIVQLRRELATARETIKEQQTELQKHRELAAMFNKEIQELDVKMKYLNMLISENNQIRGG
jgi:uncharacterized protein (DUF3084 family)